jgi:hypothetical protein
VIVFNIPESLKAEKWRRGGKVKLVKKPSKQFPVLGFNCHKNRIKENYI